jgi:hypothetical protein
MMSCGSVQFATTPAPPCGVGKSRTAAPSRAAEGGPARSIAVAGSDGRRIRVRIAAEREVREQAFRLLAVNYQARGYERPNSRPFRFTPHHVLPDTVTLVAEREGHVVATMSLVPDTGLLGLPMESIYGPEVAAMRAEGRRMAEAISLADRDLTHRDFMRVFGAMIRLSIRYHLHNGGDSWVITVNPRHSNFYRKALGFVPFGGLRAYPNVCDHPAEALLLDMDLLRDNAPKVYREVVDEPLSEAALTPPPYSPDLVRYFAERSTQSDRATMFRLIGDVERIGARPRWRDAGGREAEAFGPYREMLA